jgi:hypothetical protein
MTNPALTGATYVGPDDRRQRRDDEEQRDRVE